MPDPRLVIFDVDGTLVDSAGDIYAAMTLAFASVDQPLPSPGAVRAIVGLSLDRAFETLVPDLAHHHQKLLEGYKSAYMELRALKGAAESSPLFPGARAALDRLRDDPATVLAVATGKSKRGLDKLIEAHGLEGYFASHQTADTHPSKPHPSMVLTILDDTGVDIRRAVMIGDTSFDIDMGRAAGVHTIAVDWGYHAADSLAADAVLHHFDDLETTLATLLKDTA